jgi:hypothetical protein
MKLVTCCHLLILSSGIVMAAPTGLDKAGQLQPVVQSAGEGLA